jgi:hypothetical protein
MKLPVKTTEQPKPLDALIGIVDLAIPVRFPSRIPTLSDLARLVSAASRVLHIRDLDERIATENGAVMQLAKRRGLVS